MTAKDEKPSTPITSETPSQEKSPTPVTKKKPYIKPAFRMEKVFVTTALSCGKLNVTQSQCTLNIKS